MADKKLNVLFLCTGNSARSILAEALLGKLAGDRFNAYSAGSMPRGRVNPLALELLQAKGFDTAGLRSKSWDEFAAVGAPDMDYVFTVCDNAASEPCPVWPGRPVTAHWGIEDPDQPDLSIDRQRQAFMQAYKEMEQRIRAFTALPVEGMDADTLRQRLEAIGQGETVE